MKKFIYTFLLIVPIIIGGIMFYLDKNERDFSYFTPEEALANVKNPPWVLIEIIDTRIYERDNYAYVFFYSLLDKPKDYFVVSEFIKGKYGWKYVKMFGGGHVVEPDGSGYHLVGGSNDGEQYGLAGPDVSFVRRGNREAELIPLDNTDMKIWFIYKPSPEEEEYDLKFYDKNGKLLKSY